MKHDVILSNQNFAVIEMNRFEQIVQTYWKSGNFCIHLDATPQKSDKILITQRDLQMFLIQRQCGSILKKDALSEIERKSLINNCHAYLMCKSDNIKREHILQVAKTLVCLVPALKDSSEGKNAGYVRFFLSILIHLYM